MVSHAQDVAIREKQKMDMTGIVLVVGIVLKK